MGSVTEAASEVVDYLNSKGERVGLIKVHLYRPFSEKYFLDVLIDDENKTTITPVEITPNYPLHTIKINASYVTNYQDFNMLLKHELELNDSKYSLKNKIVRIIISKLITAVRLNLDKEKIINFIKIYNPFGVKIIIEREREVFSEEDEEDVSKLIGSPKDEVSSFLDKNKKRNPIIDETNEEIFKRVGDSLKGGTDDN